jgi:DNA repair exonuclease SbcCD nuclease subunit
MPQEGRTAGGGEAPHRRTPSPDPHGNGAEPSLTIAHTSDLHIGARSSRDGELHSLRAVLDASTEAGARALLLAGDIFDNNRVAPAIVAEAAAMLAASDIAVIILPGNHDPATPDTVYRHEALAALPHVHVLGVNAAPVLHLDHLDVEIHGVPHVAYADMPPLPPAAARTLRWQVVVAHGHWVRGPHDAHRGWLIHDDELAALPADYVALGHWDLPQPAGDGRIPAYYSGSPEIARTINIIHFTATATTVTRHPITL